MITAEKAYLEALRVISKLSSKKLELSLADLPLLAAKWKAETSAGTGGEPGATDVVLPAALFEDIAVEITYNLACLYDATARSIAAEVLFEHILKKNPVGSSS